MIGRRLDKWDIAWLIVMGGLSLFAYVVVARGQTVTEIKQQSAKHLQAMTRMTAVETVDNRSHTVAFYDGGQSGVQPLFSYGVGSYQGWWTILRASLIWNWQGSGPFTYADKCTFQDNGKSEIVACDGLIEVEGLEVRRITQRLFTKRWWGLVQLDISYGRVELSEPRLVPLSMSLKWWDKETKVTWTDYREFRGSEPRVSEWSEENERALETQQDNQRTASAKDNGTQESLLVRHVSEKVSAIDSHSIRSARGERPDSNSDVPNTASVIPALLTPPAGVWQEVKVSRKWWQRLLRIEVQR